MSSDFENPRSAALAARARVVLPSGVTHDNRYMPDGPIYIDRAQGSRKWDVDGHEYIDYWMGHGALLLGHNPPAVVEAVLRQMPRGTHYGGNSELEVQWAELITRLVPSAERVRFTASGTEAGMMAVRLARAFTGKSKLLKFEGHFHGWSDPMTAGFHAPFNVPSSIGVPRSVIDTVVVAPNNDLGAVEQILAGDGDIAAAILEPTGASYGTIPIADGFLAGLRDLTARHGVLLIFDEVITGFRYAPGGIQQVTGVLPDLTMLAKIVAGGLPGGAVVGRADILVPLEFHGDAHRDRFARIHHPGTFNANPLSAAAGIAMLEIAARGEAQPYVNQYGARLAVAMNAALRAADVATGCVYGNGSIFHVLLVPGPQADAAGRLVPGSADVLTLRAGNPGPVKQALHYEMLRRGVDLMSGQHGVCSTAHTQADFDRTVRAFYEAAQALRARGLL
jgi:glutamate-1-semialdehyde 2,1-aminomutase